MCHSKCDRCGADLPPDPGPDLLEARYALCAVCLAVITEYYRPASVWTARRRGRGGRRSRSRHRTATPSSTVVV